MQQSNGTMHRLWLIAIAMLILALALLAAPRVLSQSPVTSDAGAVETAG